MTVRTGIQPKADGFREQLRNAEARGDHGMAACMRGELERMGERETADPSPLERAVPSAPKRMGRPPKARCDHGQIMGRCVACEEDE